MRSSVEPILSLRYVSVEYNLVTGSQFVSPCVHLILLQLQMREFTKERSRELLVLWYPYYSWSLVSTSVARIMKSSQLSQYVLELGQCSFEDWCNLPEPKLYDSSCTSRKIHRLTKRAQSQGLLSQKLGQDLCEVNTSSSVDENLPPTPASAITRF